MQRTLCATEDKPQRSAWAADLRNLHPSSDESCGADLQLHSTQSPVRLIKEVYRRDWNGLGKSPVRQHARRHGRRDLHIRRIDSHDSLGGNGQLISSTPPRQLRTRSEWEQRDSYHHAGRRPKTLSKRHTLLAADRKTETRHLLSHLIQAAVYTSSPRTWAPGCNSKHHDLISIAVETLKHWCPAVPRIGIDRGLITADNANITTLK